jgi:thiamine biosynthesis lipoprotein
MRLFRFPFRAMGSPCELQLYAETRHQAKGAAQRAMADVSLLEARYSRYRADSVLSGINAAAARGEPVEVDAETAALLDYAQTCYDRSDGLFDITAGVLRQVWSFGSGRGPGRVPDPAAVAAVLRRVGWGKLRWHRPRLEFTVPGMELDLGGIVKEYAADRAGTLLLDLGIAQGLVNLGGDIRVLGPHPDGRAWSIGIRHPRRPGALLGNILVRQGALASSGDYERCLEIDGRRYGHILDPRTGWPVEGLAAVSVLASCCLVAGSASTIAMLKASAGPAWLAGLGLQHLWVDQAGRIGGNLRPLAAAEQAGA